MKVAAGIQGIRSRRSVNGVGWHIFLDNAYVTFLNVSFLNVIACLPDNYTLTGVTGNGLTIVSKGN